MSPPMNAMPEQNNLYIGEGVSIKGDIAVPDTLVVCGLLEGDISVGNLVVGATGAIKGRIFAAQNADISGKVFDKLDIKGLLILRAGSRVDGQISYGMLQIEQGASIAGGLSSAENRSAQKLGASDPRSEQDRKPQKPDAALGSEPRNSKPPSLSAVGPTHAAPAAPATTTN
jgi:cytoskeletal protein CcmA (bactofilin family)